MRYTKAKIKEAIEQSAAELFEQAGQSQREKLFLTHKQYSLDPKAGRNYSNSEDFQKTQLR